MEKKIITFGGITNVPDDGLNEAGDMAVLMNMRHKGGELVPCQPPAELLENIGSVEQALYHANSKYWLFLRADGSLKAYKDDFGNTANPVVICGEGVKSFAIMGNIVIINFADRVEYAIWEGYYRVLGALPEIDRTVTIDFLNNSILQAKTVVHSFNTSNITPEEERTAKIGSINKALDQVYQEKGYVDRVWFKIGLRLFDGTYIKSSAITQASWYDDNCANSQYRPGTGNDTNSLWTEYTGGQSYAKQAKVRYFTVKPKIDQDLFNNLRGWENVITSVDVFTTGSIMSFGLEEYVEGEKIIQDYKTLSQQGFYKAVVNTNFYKIAQYSLDGNLNWEIKSTSPSMLAVQDKLIDASQETYISNGSYAYNGKYHIFDYGKKLFNGYGFARSEAYNLGNPKKGKFSIYVFIKTDDGEKIVCKNIELSEYYSLEYYSYPDNRAYKMVVVDSNNKYKAVNLKPHPNRNEAFAFKVEMWEDTTTSEDIPIPYLANPLEDMQGQNIVVNNIENIKDTLKVSAVDNPFYFPTAQTYKFEGDIVGLASNAEAISTGQFGQYPLFVFTDTGIWAMAVDTSGQGAYTTQSPFSREVCNGSICPVSGGVVFATDKGVMAISGGQVADLSAVLDGFDVDFFEENAGMWEDIFAKAGKDDVVNPVPIREYIKGAVIAYNYHYNEIIVSNNKKGYSYVYSLTNKVWSVIDVVFDLTTNKYPELVVFDKGGGKMYTFKDGAALNKVVAITRPFTLGSIDFKRIRQAGLRTTFNGRLNFYVLGSIDGAVFKCITGKEVDADVANPNGGTYRDLIAAMSRSKQYKYFAIAIAGQMSGRVSMAELLVDAGFANNKIR